MLYIGIHLDKEHYTKIIDALKETKKLGANVLQIYLGSKYLTSLKEKIILTDYQILEIKLFLKNNNIKLFIHSILSLNYCRDPYSKRDQWGIDNLLYDMNLCYKLGGVGVVMHMGKHKTPSINISYNECIHNFINSIVIILNKTKRVKLLLETPVNRKNVIGGTIEGIKLLYDSIPDDYKKRVGICIDTQHIFASGYNLKEYFKEFNSIFKSKKPLLIHLNDSEKELGSLIDRHAPIGKGYIFSNNKDTLQYTLQYAKKYNIPILLETKYVNYKYELKLLKGGNKKDIKQLILKIFNELLIYYKSIGDKFRIDSYIKAIKSIDKYDEPIYNSDNIKDLEYIGKGFCNKVDEISETGTLKFYDNIKNGTHINSLKVLQNVFGIGPKLADKLVKKDIFTFDDLKRAVDNHNVELTDQQLLGLKYYKDLNLKIPRDEITEYTHKIREIMEKDGIKVYNAGSYRIGKSESGDIDLIVTYKRENKIIMDLFYEKMRKENIIKDTLSKGKEKSIYIVKLDKYKNYRKMDVAFINQRYIYFYLLYFGSSALFSKKIRNIASKLGYKLNEKGLFDKKSGLRIDFNPKSEKEIFDLLQIEYVTPEERG